MKITASKLRQDIFRLLDNVIETGEPLEIERGGTTLIITPLKQSFSKLKKLKKRKLSEENSDNFTHLDWSKEWRGL